MRFRKMGLVKLVYSNNGDGLGESTTRISGEQQLKLIDE